MTAIRHPFDLVLFGGTGDLAMRKLLPALYYRVREGDLGVAGRIIGVARQAMVREGYLHWIETHVRPFIPDVDFEAAKWEAFLSVIDYAVVDAGQPDHFIALAKKLGAASSDSEKVRVYYLATAPTLFTTICEHLAAAGLATPASRIVLEKPLGHDLASSQQINEAVGAIFSERQIYRIDHYLGKETVQNLLALRFGNALFEPLWSRNWVRDVQITIAETVGVENRGNFYDRTGALRDMMQNHLLQLLCITAMEPPASLNPNAIRDEKLQVLRSLKTFAFPDVLSRTVRGQYQAGAVGGMPVPGYLDEPGIDVQSHTETFVAIKAELANWRWAGVPFYLRTGKRMQERRAEIVINFRPVPHYIFDQSGSQTLNNRLVIRLQPDDGLTLHLLAKTPGDGMRLAPINLNLDFSDTFKARRLDAYERLLLDVLRGNLTLFMRRDELDAAWCWMEPILHAWGEFPERPKAYTAGTWGPAASSALIGRDGLSWHEES